MSDERGQALDQELADLALEAARLAATLVRGRAAQGVTVAATKTSDIDVVTEADRAAETLIRDTIRARRPDDAFLGEEGDDEAGTSGVRWVIDPIDGTVNFLYGLPQFAVSIAAEVDGRAVAGVVLNAATGTEYVARTEDGRTVARRDGRPIGVRAEAPLSHRLLATGFSYDREVRVRQAEALTRLIPHVRDVRRLGSCALDLCLVAEGSLDGYVEEGVNLWDHAAGGLIARAAGARTAIGTGVGGLELLLCGPAHGFDELSRAIEDAGFVVPGTMAPTGE
ncbi:fructose-1,6-bisphosphatase [Nocardioides szechwanensis]|uniref:Inositol-1-monophosphatase n=1 Tax=Nocardioides szechwanensis TaxID=1005944 RepID=A0A1G9VZP2_9ACTN|nr:inositol monophosphatase family protein [Nocardioides szechwanensis]GEP32796.1 fructose-1,6-bisphosphatase [Nocardioides szechwanensis]SDM77366.1 myo-inositol-1(or 4)-monophosphatase [Nocardioides szechwanensis]